MFSGDSQRSRVSGGEGDVLGSGWSGRTLASGPAGEGRETGAEASVLTRRGRVGEGEIDTGVTGGPAGEASWATTSGKGLISVWGRGGLTTGSRVLTSSWVVEMDWEESGRAVWGAGGCGR